MIRQQSVDEKTNILAPKGGVPRKMGAIVRAVRYPLTSSFSGERRQIVDYRFLGTSGLEVSTLSFGTMTLGGEGRFAAMGNVQVEEARRLVGICIDAGVNLFDTADIYSNGRSEEVLGQALGARRKELVLATKVFNRLEPGTNKAGLSRRHIIEG